MRGIRFRAYIPETGDFIYFGIGEKCFSSYSKDGEKFDIEDIREYKIEQFTGLRDKNGVEIYEGDIMENNTTKTAAVVIWDNQVPMFMSKPINSDRLPSCTFAVYDNIIGNVHENPELLKESK